jgi:hypothetical protein
VSVGNRLWEKRTRDDGKSWRKGSVCMRSGCWMGVWAFIHFQPWHSRAEQRSCSSASIAPHEVRHVQNGSGDHIDMVPVK